MSYMTITCCKCGKVADIEQWTKRPVTGELPPGQFQCPSCNFAFQRRKVTPDVVKPNGFVIPGNIKLVPCAGVI